MHLTGIADTLRYTGTPMEIALTPNVLRDFQRGIHLMSEMALHILLAKIRANVNALFHAEETENIGLGIQARESLRELLKLDAPVSELLENYLRR